MGTPLYLTLAFGAAPVRHSPALGHSPPSCLRLPHSPAPTGGTNAHIWAAWAYLAAKLGNVTLARKLYDAAIVANPQHAAAWHGWGLLEKEQGNFLRWVGGACGCGWVGGWWWCVCVCVGGGGGGGGGRRALA